ncbi:uncharacterized protein LOC111715343 [Eurytemora carolleeae]|uniref:uncharacterized protein LOC111715343 n=1 Tax=Eurytemora carolleeae TaxID=1294199 RepID=UPI000C762AD8|nr:uncharacterized protein LOC111715343 [Eurytemora carolleeae]|eukprot:XP_023346430.1 uncharacterized protein LOC111715343 [Eurytemora affinis]
MAVIKSNFFTERENSVLYKKMSTLEQKDKDVSQKVQGIPGFLQEQDIPGFLQEQDIPGSLQELGIPGFRQEQDIPGLLQEQGLGILGPFEMNETGNLSWALGCSDLNQTDEIMVEACSYWIEGVTLMCVGILGILMNFLAILLLSSKLMKEQISN